MKPVEQILYLGYKDHIDANEKKYTPVTKRRGKIYTYLSHNYIAIWVKLLKAKEDLVNMIKHYRPHYPNQDPYFSHTFYEPQGFILEIVG
jgi:hypothetical protein